MASSADDVGYCCLCVSRSHCVLTCLLLGDATRSCIINQSHITLVSLPLRNAYHVCSPSPTRNEKPAPFSFRSRNRTPKCNGRKIINTQYPGSRSPESHCTRSCSPWNSDEPTLSTLTSFTETGAAAPSAHSAFIRPKNYAPCTGGR